MGFALGYDGSAQPRSKVVRKFVQVGVAVDLDRHLGCIADHVTIVAPLKMVFQFGSCLSVHRVVKVIRELFQKIRAGHCLPSPPVRFLKYLFNRSRSCSRARSRRDLTAGILKSKASAASSVVSPSTLRMTNTRRKRGGNPWIVLPRISFNSPWL